MRNYLLLFCCLLFVTIQTTAQPNIIFVIADDIGVDVTPGYHQINPSASTPTLDSLRSIGITFDNVFSAPVCTPTRAAIMSGKYGIKTGVIGIPGVLDLEHKSLFRALSEETNNLYSDAVIGKWHISQGLDIQHPHDHGVDYYMGVIGGGVGDYYNWNKTEDGETHFDTNYVTTVFTNRSIDWISEQTQPWFLWLAHVAPHNPVHEPPAHMYSISNTNSNFRKYLAMIESIDYELNRLFSSMDLATRQNTLVIFLGDNGTPGSSLQDYPERHGKGSLYQGGIRVPLIIAGAGVSRKNEREKALIHVTDLYATLLEYSGLDLPGGLYNSLSFKHVLSGNSGPTRDYNYSEINNTENNNGHTIRNKQYKLINFDDGRQEYYDLFVDSLEFNNLLLGNLTGEQQTIKEDLEIEAYQIRESWSCRDHIQNGNEEGIDCGGSQCDPCNTTSVDNPGSELAINYYPNPVSNYIYFESGIEKIMEISIYDSFGQLLHFVTGLNDNTIRLNLAEFSSQLLLAKITTSNKSKNIKLMKQ